MIELNLLPQEFVKKKKKIKLPEIPIIPTVGAILAALLVIQFLLSGFIFLNKQELGNLDKVWKNLAPKKQELDEIKRKITSIDKKMQTIEGLIHKQLNWSRLLNELSNSLTPNVWLTELAYGEKTEKETQSRPPKDHIIGRDKVKTGVAETMQVRTLALRGFASGKGEETTAHIAQFIRSLKANKNFFKDFDDIELISIKKSVVAEQDVMDFTLVCRFKVREGD